MPAARDFTEDLIAAGDRYLAVIGEDAARADPEGRVEARSRLLCAGLGLLAEAAYRALGGERRGAEVGRAAAMLSLVTKIDDQVIDAPAFHGGASTDRAALREKTRAFLQPTLDSIRAARPANGEPRAAFAAALGDVLRDLSGDPARLERLLAVIAQGWEIQVRAVAVLTSHPARVTRAEVAEITRAISGAWLLMITMVGMLPASSSRAFSRAEEDAFFRAGAAIQRADALADLDKDLADGHLSSWPGKRLWEAAPGAYLDAAVRADHRAVYALVRAHEVDRNGLREPDTSALAALGDVPALLAWIHAYLVRRYLDHPLCARERAALLPLPTLPAPAARRLFPCSVP